MHFFFQLNIVNEKMYEVLSDIYQEFLQLFDTDVFHMGGDEVNMHCYNTSAEIRSHLDLHGKQGTEDDILDLWRTFQRKAFRLVSFRLFMYYVIYLVVVYGKPTYYGIFYINRIISVWAKD